MPRSGSIVWEIAILEIPARSGTAIPLEKGAAVKLINTFGSQVVDTWALQRRDASEHLSVEHTRRMLYRLFPGKGDTPYSNRRTPPLVLEEDTSPGRYDMLLACCNKWLYKHCGCRPGHANCHDNFRQALFDAGFDAFRAEPAQSMDEHTGARQ
jgi:uncharacterized protein YcgI (DUF1989 family)